MKPSAALPSFLVLDKMIESWLLEDIGRGDRTTEGLNNATVQTDAYWVAKESGIIAGLPIAARVFHRLDESCTFKAMAAEGQWCERGQVVAEISGSLSTLLAAERVAINLAMRLSGIATMTSKYVAQIADLPAQFADTRKTTPGMRLLEKYATRVGGAVNQRMGLDDGVLVKDNHIAAAGSIRDAIAQVRDHIPYTMSVEVETETLDQVAEAIACDVDIIMLDNMPQPMMKKAVQMIRGAKSFVKIEASGNVILETIRAVAETGVDYISSSAPITRSTWLDLSMKIGQSSLQQTETN
ncbi:MAG: carboxylating nicotinate-nucleotide diphosphorylase [Cyanobacteria bacterium J06638_28]